MNTETENLYLALDFLSDIELYYTSPDQVKKDLITVKGEEVHHIHKVMRHDPGDDVYITNGKGIIYVASITQINKDYLTAEVKSYIKYSNPLYNITFCIPRLKNPDRFEFALEKCVELGITNFIIYQAENSVAKGEKLDRWNKILLAAMKQSLRSYLPFVDYKESLSGITDQKGNIITLDQNSGQEFSETRFKNEEKYYFVFGPEGGFSSREKELLTNSYQYRLTNNRLRSETAIITAAALISTKI